MQAIRIHRFGAPEVLQGEPRNQRQAAAPPVLVQPGTPKPILEDPVGKILVVNSNTSPAATERIVAGCTPYLRPETEVTYLNAEAGPQGIDSLLDVAVSGIETVRLF